MFSTQRKLPLGADFLPFSSYFFNKLKGIVSSHYTSVAIGHPKKNHQSSGAYELWNVWLEALHLSYAKE